MAVPKRIGEAKGLWKGTSQLNQSWLPPEGRVSTSASRLHVDTDADGHYATIAYTWNYEGKPQEGTMIVCMAGKTKAVEIGWVDTWHQASGVMHLVGTEGETGAVRTKGSFSAGGETWGWTIALETVGDELRLTMENVSPKGEADWAVRAVYTRE